MNHECDYCDEGNAEWTYVTVGRGWKFLCEVCYEYASPIIREYCEVIVPSRYYPTFNYDTRTVE